MEIFFPLFIVLLGCKHAFKPHYCTWLDYIFQLIICCISLP